MKTKRIHIIAASICLIFLFGNTHVYAAEYYGDFQYEDNGDTVSVYAYNGSDKEVTIPAYINEKKVTEISDYAFLLCNSVEKIIVPSTVTKIDANAFSGAANLTKVVLASSDTKIDDSTGTTADKISDKKGNGQTNSAKMPDNSSDNKTASNGGEKASATEKKSQYTVTVDPSIDTAEKEKKLAKQHSNQNGSQNNSKQETTTQSSSNKKATTTQSNSKQGTTTQNNSKQGTATTKNSSEHKTTTQNNVTEIAGIEEGADVAEATTSINENNTASKENKSFPLWEIVCIIAVWIAVVVMDRIIRKRKK